MLRAGHPHGGLGMCCDGGRVAVAARSIVLRRHRPVDGHQHLLPHPPQQTGGTGLAHQGREPHAIVGVRPQPAGQRVGRKIRGPAHGGDPRSASAANSAAASCTSLYVKLKQSLRSITLPSSWKPSTPKTS